MSSIKTVAILGATGSLGCVLVPALLAAGFEVTCITRPNSEVALPKGSNVKKADYNDLSGLADAFEGQQVVIEAFNPAASVHQGLIVHACLAAGVQRIITPDFSGDTFNQNSHEFFIFDTKRRAQRELESVVAASGGKLTWTAIITGVWYDWTIEQGIFWVNRNNRVVTRYGSGDQKFSMSRRSLNAEALVHVLRNPDRYRNRQAYFASHIVTTNQLISIINELGLEGWTVLDVPMEGYMEEAREKWLKDTDSGIENRLASEAYKMFSCVALLHETNRYGSDFSDKIEPGWDEDDDALKRSLKLLLCSGDVSQ